MVDEVLQGGYRWVHQGGYTGLGLGTLAWVLPGLTTGLLAVLATGS